MIILFHKSQSNKKLSQFFSAHEFCCPCCGYALIDTDLPILLDRIRAELGIPVKVTSGYRCPRHNAAVGGALMSRHLIGCAADITWAGSVLNLKEESLFRKNFIPSLAKTDHKLYGVGWGKSYMHVDTDVSRKSFTQWVYQ